MKQKKSKVVYTPNKSFDCKRPLGWDEMAKKLTIAVNRYNQQNKNSEYKVEVQAVGDPKMMKLYLETNHHRIWIESTRNKRMHFDLLCSRNSLTNSKFIQDGVKYGHFLLIAKDTSAKWLDKKYEFLYKISPFIQREVA
jgi:hypothetical protein